SVVSPEGQSKSRGRATVPVDLPLNSHEFRNTHPDSTCCVAHTGSGPAATPEPIQLTVRGLTDEIHPAWPNCAEATQPKGKIRQPRFKGLLSRGLCAARRAAGSYARRLEEPGLKLRVTVRVLPDEFYTR